jgi:uncharacterized membrane protein YebE (DUF533 family)
MIAAANADGTIDSQEKATILKHLREAGANPEEEAFLVGELNSPPSIDSLLPTISGPEMAAEVYAVSLLAVDVDTKAERDYLNYLRSRLEMDESKVEEIHKQLNIPI